MGNNQILLAKNITKIFPGVIALKNVNFGVSKGEIHCLVGENGAGKSTLVKVFAGQYIPNEGEILINGRSVKFVNPNDALMNGIGVIHQELHLVPFLSVAENLLLGHLPSKAGFINWKQLNKYAVLNMNKLGLDINPQTEVFKLSAAQQQLIKITHILSLSDEKILIMDEPTASLSEKEVNNLFNIIFDLKQKGLAIVYVSHRLDEVFAIADRITVLRDGNIVGSGRRSELSQDDVIKMMVGGDISLFSKKRKHKKGKKILEVKGLTRKGVIENVSFDVYEGEVVGFGGLMGAGRNEVVKCIFGVDSFNEGEIRIDGKLVNINNPRMAVRLGLGFVPENRKTQSIIPMLSLKDNLVMSSLDRIKKLGWIIMRKEIKLVNKYINSLKIKAPSVNSVIDSLSGGNQQKVIIGRWLATSPKILILNEPTRGIDVGTKAEIHKIMEVLTEKGMAIILITSELPELLKMSDRVYVMNKGRILKELIGSKANKYKVMKIAAS